jgi:hypothetical protein
MYSLHTIGFFVLCYFTFFFFFIKLLQYCVYDVIQYINVYNTTLQLILLYNNTRPTRARSNPDEPISCVECVRVTTIYNACTISLYCNIINNIMVCFVYLPTCKLSSRYWQTNYWRPYGQDTSSARSGRYPNPFYNYINLIYFTQFFSAV